MNIREISEICRDKKVVVEYLQLHHILHQAVQCGNCQRPCTMVKQSAKLAGFVWRCPGCRRKQSLLKDSYLENAKIAPSTLVYMVYYWSTRVPLHIVMEHVEVGTHTGVNWCQYFRKICSWKLCQTSIQLGGPGKEVQIDESLFVRAKYHRGRNTNRADTWVFGAYDVNYKVGYIKVVRKRDAATLLPIIQRVIAPGSIVVSDEWRAYRSIAHLPGNYQHKTVNHSRYFVDPATGTHTNNVESYWSRAKASFKKMHVTSKPMVPSYLDEFMWRERYGKTDKMAYLNILRNIAEKYPC